MKLSPITVTLPPIIGAERLTLGNVAMMTLGATQEIIFRREGQDKDTYLRSSIFATAHLVLAQGKLSCQDFLRNRARKTRGH
jgi:hypothetical protein